MIRTLFGRQAKLCVANECLILGVPASLFANHSVPFETTKILQFLRRFIMTHGLL